MRHIINRNKRTVGVVRKSGEVMVSGELRGHLRAEGDTLIIECPEGNRKGIVNSAGEIWSTQPTRQQGLLSPNGDLVLTGSRELHWL